MKKRPCDCKDMHTVRKLQEQGLKIRDCSIEVRPVNVILEVGACTVKIPQIVFQRLAEWYLEEQELKDTKDYWDENWGDGD